MNIVRIKETGKIGYIESVNEEYLITLEDDSQGYFSENELEFFNFPTGIVFNEDEKTLLKSALDFCGDRVANRVGYSSGEVYWNLMEKISKQ